MWGWQLGSAASIALLVVVPVLAAAGGALVQDQFWMWEGTGPQRESSVVLQV